MSLPELTGDGGPVFHLSAISKSFGAVRALSNVDLKIRPGECFGLVGHNGAGKSTLMQILAGTLAPDTGDLAAGDLTAGGRRLTGRWNVQRAHAEGIRCVFQELSLCPNLSIAENTRVAHLSINGWSWRKKAAQLMFSQMDAIFPGHGLTQGMIVGDLAIGQRQMVEIARAFTVSDQPVQLVILDEPTSSLDNTAAEQLLRFVRRFVAGGKSVILISHKLGEILHASDRAVVMRDGCVVADRPTSLFTRDGLVEAMGQARPSRDIGVARRAAAGVVRVGAQRQGSLPFIAHAGEVIGLAGLSGHGQTQLLLDIHDGGIGTKVDAPVALVAGDRQSDGIFPVWSIGANMSVRALRQFCVNGLIDLKAEAAFARQWREKLALVTPSIDNPILSLSGGNQQKALFARALGSDASIILMDDPMRGVDIGTKREVYALIAQEAAKGRTFLWYTTEFDELFHCDRTYVFSAGHIVGEIAGADISEEKVLQYSFHEPSAPAMPGARA